MYIRTSLLAVLAAASATQAFQLSEISAEVSSAASEAKRGLLDLVGNVINRQQSSCPAVWSEISSTLTEQFLGDGECTDAARAAIRAAFHDCFNGACDGSLILANECSNSENRGLERLCTQLGGLAKEKDVGVADLIQFAAAHAIKTCPGGPTVPVKIGRKDSSTANPTGIIPSGKSKAPDLIQLFASKGFSPIDLAALVGAHTVAKQRFEDPAQAGASLDSTPGQWDTTFYQETLRRRGAPFTIESDKNLAGNLATKVPMTTFSLSRSAWGLAFVPAMEKLSLMGVGGGVELTDCTGALPGGSAKREVKRGDLWERLGW